MFVQLSKEKIEKYLTTNQKNIICYDTIDSTNTALKEMAKKGAKEGTVLVTDMQTNGRGRMGRQFFSPKGCGVYFSILLRPEIAAPQTVLITSAAAVAVRRSIKQLLNLDTQIKWVNDIYYNNKKLCGILTEGATDAKTGTLLYAVLGIGINLLPPPNGYPLDFAHKTTNLSACFGNLPIDFPNKLVAQVLYQFDTLYNALLEKKYMREYKEASCVIGKQIEILSGANLGSAFAEDIDEDANLVVRLPNGQHVLLSSGDVSICF